MKRPSVARVSRSGAARLAALAMLVALLLSACTGTSEEQAPTLLIVGVLDGTTPQLALVEDVPSPATVNDRLRFVPGSRRPLQAPAVAIDVTERDLGRGVAWVLTREVAGGTTTRAYLEPFAVSDIDPAAPAAFAPAGPPLELVGPGGILPLDDSPNTVVCPTAVQASRSGEWLLVLDVPRECTPASGDFPVLWLVNSAAGTAGTLQESNVVLGVQPYTDQRRENERGFFLVAGTATAQVYAIDFETGVSSWFGQRELAADPYELRHAAGGGSTLVGFTTSQLVGVDLERPAGSDRLGPVTAATSARQVVVDPTAVRHVLLLTDTQVEVHAALAQDAPAPDSVTFAGAGASIDGPRAYGYVIAGGQMMLVDLYTGGGAGDSLRTFAYSVPELTLPTGPTGRPLGVVSWVRAAEPLLGP